MYERAVELGRAAAVNELVNVDFDGCEISYATAIRMLEAVLEADDEPGPSSLSPPPPEAKEEGSATVTINGLEQEDRATVIKRKSNGFFFFSVGMSGSY
jgi:serine/threonine-protein kinase ULK/ATG1